MPYAELKRLSAGEFKRLCGVRRETFSEMVNVLRPQLERHGKRGGQNTLIVEDQLLMALEHWRACRSQFHIATTWGVHETTVGRIIKKIDQGKTHDFKLLKRSHLPFVYSQLCLADRGYQGFANRHAGACIPTKKPRNQPLTREEKEYNRALARLRVRVEHGIRRGNA